MTSAVRALQTLAETLAGDPLTVDEVVAHLGTASARSAGNVSVNPTDASFTAASVVRQGTTNVPAHVTLTLAQPTTLNALERSFGDYKKIAPDDEQLWQAIFKPNIPGKPYTVALIAAYRGDDVSRITLRRDARL